MKKLISMLVMAAIMTFAVFASVNSPPETAIQKQTIKKSSTQSAEFKRLETPLKKSVHNMPQIYQKSFAVDLTFTTPKTNQEINLQTNNYKSGARKIPDKIQNKEINLSTNIRGYGSPPIVMRN